MQKQKIPSCLVLESMWYVYLDINDSELVGVNGSGKSNFFRGKGTPFSQTLAIQFVLSPKYMKIDEEQMRGLFHVSNLDLVSFVERASRCRK